MRRVDTLMHTLDNKIRIMRGTVLRSNGRINLHPTLTIIEFRQSFAIFGLEKAQNRGLCFEVQV